jgi:ABC-2 type transport system ATP-binding protein
MIEASGLTKRYGAYTAVDDVSFRAEPGRVTGFLGPNGAGKSTSMRMLVGLTPPTDGTATVLGVPYRSIPNPGTRVGVLLDASAQHNGRTGREVLPWAPADGPADLPRRRDARAGRPDARGGQAAARQLLARHAPAARHRARAARRPEVLILDEPANGLDPAGIRWMRGLLRGFADQGGTVLLSSHLLHEVEAIADELLIIGRGRIVAEGNKDVLLASGAVFVRGLDERLLADALTAARIGFVEVPGGGLQTESSAEDVGRAAAAAAVVLTELRPAVGAGLEEMFLSLTADDAREAVPAGARA